MIKKPLLLLLCIAFLSFAGCKSSVTDKISGNSAAENTESSSSRKEAEAVGETVDTASPDGSADSEYKSSEASGSDKDYKALKENSLSDKEGSDGLTGNFDDSVELPDHEWN